MFSRARRPASGRPKPFSAIGRLQLESLEGREVPATLIGLTNVNSLVTFDSATPGTLIGSAVAVTGLTAGDVLVGIDYRPATNTLYGLGRVSSQLYTIAYTPGGSTAADGSGTFRRSRSQGSAGNPAKSFGVSEAALEEQ